MFKHNIGWEINARTLRLISEWSPAYGPQLRAWLYLDRIVREEIAQDRGLVWC